MTRRKTPTPRDRQEREGHLAWLRGFFGRGVCPYQAAFTLLNPLRRLILSPGQLMERLHLEPDHRVLELGPGPGYFTPTTAGALPVGRLVSLDLQYEMLGLLRRRLPRSKRMPDVALCQGDARHLPFAPDSFDVVYLVAVLGEVPDPGQCLHACTRVLRRGGLLSITEQPGDPDALSESEIKRLAEPAGARFRERYGTGKSFTLNFSADY